MALTILKLLRVNTLGIEPDKKKFVEFKLFLFKAVNHLLMLGGSLVTTAWRVLRLRMEETPSSFGGKLQISSRGQPTRGGPPAWGLGVGLTTHHKK
jgi:hypothetical protein